MRLLENSKVELDSSEWANIRESLSKYETDSIWSIYWHGAFERTGWITFNSKNAAMMFVLRWS
jgi:hypothetical protein